MGIASIGLLPIVHFRASGPSSELLVGIGQIGATFLIAYGVEISWFLKESRVRSINREYWVGTVGGIGGCGMLGIAIALGLSAAADSPTTWSTQFAFSWVLISIGSLGGLVALLPLVLYEWSHMLHAEYPDE
jgi:hypothetical protein